MTCGPWSKAGNPRLPPQRVYNALAKLLMSEWWSIARRHGVQEQTVAGVHGAVHRPAD